MELPRYPSWHYRRYGVEALLALGRKAEGVKYAEASRGPNQPDSMIDQTCEEILISSGLHEEAYQDNVNYHVHIFEEVANRSHCDPKTLTRAARDYLDSASEFALGSAMVALRWLSEGWGYEVTSVDVVKAYDRALDAASKLNKVDDITSKIRELVERNESASTLFVRQSLHVRLCGQLSMVNEV